MKKQEENLHGNLDSRGRAGLRMSSYAVPGSSKSDSSVTESGTTSTVSVPQQSSTKSPQPGTSNKNSSNDNNQQETESFVIVNAADLDHNNIKPRFHVLSECMLYI